MRLVAVNLGIFVILWYKNFSLHKIWIWLITFVKDTMVGELNTFC